MDSDFSSEELSSDEELQDEFSRGNLKPGLIVRKTRLKVFANHVTEMQEKLASMKKKELEWLERMDVTGVVAESAKSGDDDEEDEDSGLDPEDDFKREMLFYHQAQASVLIGLRKLEELGVPSQRPEDYYAEMVKTDDHMRKVRQCLLSRQKVLEQKEKTRKMRELKKYGKKVQHEVLQKRREEKKATLEAVKKFKKGRGERPSFLGSVAEDSSFPVAVEGRKERLNAAHKESARQNTGRKRPTEKSKKRVIKDKKFGFGGRKRWSKSNTAESSADMSSFSAAKHSRTTRTPGGTSRTPGGTSRKPGGTTRTPGGTSSKGKRGRFDGGKKGAKGNKTVRFGKSRRQKMKLK